MPQQELPRASEASAAPLPEGVRRLPLEMHRDPRGCLTEIFRAEWPIGVCPVQWNVVRSTPRVLRGVHVHLVHWDYLVVIAGRATVGLVDLRQERPSVAPGAMIELRGDRLEALIIPPGIAHGFYFPEESLHLYSVTETWNPADELGCVWSDPELGLAWPDPDPLLSERDRTAQGLTVLRAELQRLRVASGGDRAPVRV